MVRVENVLDTWKAIRRDTAQAVEEFPADDFDFRPAADVMSAREIGRHILDAGHALTGMLLDGVDDFSVPGTRDRFAAYFPALDRDAGAVEMAGALRSTIEERCAQLSTRPPEFWAHMMTRMDGQRVTRLEMLQFVKEHELTHRAQLFLCLRLKGIVPPTTRRRMAKK